MQCLNPIAITVEADEYHSSGRQFVPCGKCPACLSNRRQVWHVRLALEQLFHDNSYFVTLTYNDKNLNYALDNNNNSVPVVSRRDVQLFFKRLRSYLPSKFRYYCVSEYGPNTLRPHYHFIIFCSCGYNTFSSLVEKAWSLNGKSIGFSKVDFVTSARIGYVTKYVQLKTKIPDFLKENYPPFTLMSKNLGLDYLSSDILDYYSKCSLEKCLSIRVEGKNFYLPRYFIERIYTKDFVYKLRSYLRSKKDSTFSHHSDEELLDYAHSKSLGDKSFCDRINKNLYKNRKL